MMQFSFVVIYLLIIPSSHLINGLFSGFYHAKEQEDYGGAFLIHKDRFLKAYEPLQRAGYPEGVIFMIIHLSKNVCPDCRTIFSRDYFDFSSDHLSSTTNIIGTMSLDTQKKLLNHLNIHLEKYVKDLKHATVMNITTHNNKIVGIIPFSQEIANPNSLDHAYHHIHQQMRQYFFQATFYSLHRHFPDNVVVYVATDSDKQLLQSWNIPAKEIIVMDSILSQVPHEQYFFFDPHRKEPRPRNQLLPKYSLLDAMNRLKTHPSWSDYRYVYYTEGDQILHLRKLKYLLRAVDSRNGKDILITHRMQTLPLFQNIPPQHSEGWSYQKISNIHLITEMFPLEPIGSCCDNARFNFPDCGNWWYYCQNWGLRNHTVWLRHGPDGFTMPLSTEHQGICSYSPNQILCELPQQSQHCEGKNKNRYNTSALCGEVEFSLERQNSFAFIDNNGNGNGNNGNGNKKKKSDHEHDHDHEPRGR